MTFIVENVSKSVYSVLCFQSLYHQLYHRIWLSLLLSSYIHVSTTSYPLRKTDHVNLGRLLLSLSKHRPMVSLSNRVAEGKRTADQHVSAASSSSLKVCWNHWPLVVSDKKELKQEIASKQARNLLWRCSHKQDMLMLLCSFLCCPFA